MNLDKIDFFISLAIEEAKIALKNYEVPVGLVAISNEEIIYKTHNKGKIHAELECLLSKDNVEEIYLTLEPCPMCLFFSFECKVKKIFFGAYNLDYGACGGKFLLKNQINNYFNTETFGGFRERECSDLLKEYFKMKRI